MRGDGGRSGGASVQTTARYKRRTHTPCPHLSTETSDFPAVLLMFFAALGTALSPVPGDTNVIVDGMRANGVDYSDGFRSGIVVGLYAMWQSRTTLLNLHSPTVQNSHRLRAARRDRSTSLWLDNSRAAITFSCDGRCRQHHADTHADPESGDHVDLQSIIHAHDLIFHVDIHDTYRPPLGIVALLLILKNARPQFNYSGRNR